MATEHLLLALRILAGLILLAFLLALFLMMWRDYRVVSREVESRTRNRGRLVVISTRGSAAPPPGTVFPLLPLNSLGRGPTNSIILSDSFSSNEHALVTLRGGQWWLEDRGSSNGTLLNGYRIEGPVVISSGDVIGLGQIELKLELE
jgi:hypothetical protein